MVDSAIRKSSWHHRNCSTHANAELILAIQTLFAESGHHPDFAEEVLEEGL